MSKNFTLPFSNLSKSAPQRRAFVIPGSPPPEQPAQASAACCSPGPGGQSGYQPGNGPITNWKADGYLSTIIPVADDRMTIDEYVTDGIVDAPQWALETWLASIATRTTSRKRSTSGPKTAGVDLTLTLSEEARASASAQGNRTLCPAFLVTATHNGNINLGQVTFSLAAFLDDDEAVSISGMQLTPLALGVTRWMLIAHRDENGRVTPGIFDIRKDWTVSLGGTAVPLTAAAAPNDATSVTPTNGIEWTDRSAVLTVSGGATGADFTFETVVPGTPAWNHLVDKVRRLVP